MKRLLIISSLVLCGAAWAAEPPVTTITGEVLEVRTVDAYT